MGDVHVLLVEDERRFAHLLARRLEEAGFAASLAFTGTQGLERATHGDLDLAVVDVMLPEMDGVKLTRTLRDQGSQLPILMLTARDAVDDRVRGLQAGADDYLVKPFAIPELLARIRALLRRGRTDQVLKLQHEDLEMDLVTRKVARAGQAIELTVKEFEILEYLLRHVSRVVSREMLTRDVWHVAARATPLDNVIDVSIARLRRKIDDAFPVKLLQTVRGVGFVLRRERG